ncbi:Uncharacterized protein conserved in bacteria [Chlamydia trachomatis]|nr:Uncharacterized protein conserved in bacteria [Chlamydia trachomatis]
MAKCLTLNAHSWLEDIPLKRLFDIAEHILEMDYDIVCLQEINQLRTSPVAKELQNYIPIAETPPIHEDNYALYLVNYLRNHGRNYYWSWAYDHIGYQDFHEGVVILSKTPFEAQDILVSDFDDETNFHTRRVLVAQMELDGVPVTVTSLHLSWEGRGFEPEWQRLEHYLQGFSTPLLLMGDFNAPTHSDGYRLILESSLGLHDCHETAVHSQGDHTIVADIDGWEGNEDALKVDHIFASKELEVKMSFVSFDGGNAPVVSDHYGIAVEVGWV